MKNKITIIVTLCLTVLTSENSLAESVCTFPALAKYTITNKLKQTSTHLDLYRTKNKVAQVYPDTGITEYWELNIRDQIKPTRFFNYYARGIEYQPNEVVHGKTETDWMYRFQLVSESFINKANIESTQQTGCNLTQSLRTQTPILDYEIKYQPARNLVTEFLIKDKQSQQIIEHWYLNDTNESAALATNLFANLATYQTTDFADIGDDHSDPFLTKMVALGFIEPGASGYYHAFEENEVKPMGQHHHH